MNAAIERVIAKLDLLRMEDPSWWVFGAVNHHYRLGNKLTGLEISALEATYKISLPEEYRLFLQMVGNGGAGPGYGLERFGYVQSIRQIPTANRKGPLKTVVAMPGMTIAQQDLYDDAGNSVDPFDVTFYQLIKELAADGTYGTDRPARPFPLIEPLYPPPVELWELGQGKWDDRAKSLYSQHQKSWTQLDFRAGTISLVDYGCGMCAILVLNGKFQGQIWIVDPNAECCTPFAEMANLHYAHDSVDTKDEGKEFTFLDWYEHWLDHARVEAKQAYSKPESLHE